MAVMIANCREEVPFALSTFSSVLWVVNCKYEFTYELPQSYMLKKEQNVFHPHLHVLVCLSEFHKSIIFQPSRSVQ